MKRKSYERNRRLAGQTQQPIYTKKRMKKMSVQITKEDFLKYKQIQMSGRYNMFMDARNVMNIMGLDKDQYFKILQEYQKLDEAWGNEVQEEKTVSDTGYPIKKFKENCEKVKDALIKKDKR